MSLQINNNKKNSLVKVVPSKSPLQVLLQWAVGIAKYLFPKKAVYICHISHIKKLFRQTVGIKIICTQFYPL